MKIRIEKITNGWLLTVVSTTDRASKYFEDIVALADYLKVLCRTQAERMFGRQATK